MIAVRIRLGEKAGPVVAVGSRVAESSKPFELTVLVVSTRCVGKEGKKMEVRT
jgi:hypothetical protein